MLQDLDPFERDGGTEGRRKRRRGEETRKTEIVTRLSTGSQLVLGWHERDRDVVGRRSAFSKQLRACAQTHGGLCHGGLSSRITVGRPSLGLAFLSRENFRANCWCFSTILSPHPPSKILNFTVRSLVILGTEVSGGHFRQLLKSQEKLDSFPSLCFLK